RRYATNGVVPPVEWRTWTRRTTRDFGRGRIPPRVGAPGQGQGPTATARANFDSPLLPRKAVGFGLAGIFGSRERSLGRKRQADRSNRCSPADGTDSSLVEQPECSGKLVR